MSRASAWAPALALALTLALALVLAGPAQAQPLADPRVDWSSADSAHFRVHYRHGQRAQALAVAQAAERVYPRVTQALQWQPRTRTEIVVYSEFDIANGFATPLPFNLMGVFLTPPDDGELLDNSAWLDLLLVHEFTHAVHMDKVRGVPGVLQNIFGKVPWFIPHIFQPPWMLEGVAVWMESEPSAGRGRLRGPWFEAWLRNERQRGFVSLAELNADGRRLPLNQQYLYGAYFMDFMARRYGPDKVQALVHQTSGNIVPRLHSAPFAATGKMMDTLWLEFLADLGQEVDTRSSAILSQPAVVGSALTAAQLNIGSVAALPSVSGVGWLAVLEDGLSGSHLVRLAADGRQQRLQRVNRGARVDVAADGTVLLTQPDLCNTLYYGYDLYRLHSGTLEQLSHCAHLRRAVKAGASLVALQLDAGKSRLVQWLQASALGMSQPPRVLLDPADGQELVDLAAAPDGQRVTVLSRRGADWQLLEVDLSAAAGSAPRLLLARNTPMQSLRQGAAGLEFIMAEGGVPNVWRLQGGQLLRLTHSHTAVLGHAGTAADGSLVSVGISGAGAVLQRLAQPLALQSLEASTAVVAAAEPAAAGTAAAALGEARPYSALQTLRPRAWLPAVGFDRGLSTLGATTSGADALGWHQYAVLAQVETSQKELLGSLEYQYVGSHSVAIQRQLTAQAWSTVDKKETTTVFDRSTKLQWLSQFPFSRLERRVVLGVGAAAHWTDRVDLPAGTSSRRHDERLLAGLLDVDLSNSDWASEGRNRGWHGSLLVESYRPLSSGDPLRYDGTVVRGDLRGYLPLGRSVLALRATEARAQDRTEPFQLGGASDDLLQLGPTLNVRQLSLRGYRSTEPALSGRNARVVSLEWRTPLADIDRHAMVPPIGINRLSAAVFVDAGGAWSVGRGPDLWRRGVGVEVLGEVKLLYAFGLQLRVGLAHGLDAPKDTLGYLTAGRSF